MELSTSTYKHCFENDVTCLNNVVSAFNILATEAQASRYGPSYAVVGHTLLEISCLLSTYTLRIHHGIWSGIGKSTSDQHHSNSVLSSFMK